MDEAAVFTYGRDSLFLLHGHQVSHLFARFNNLIGLLLRYIVKPLRIKNYATSFDSGRVFRTEKRIYAWASSRRVLTMLGHTHRPLFKSLSKRDYLRFTIEQLCRIYPAADPFDQRQLEARIRSHAHALRQYRRNGIRERSDESLYNADLHVPCVFNSGCCVGKRGVTGLEIEDGMISLVHWHDAAHTRRQLNLLAKEITIHGRWHRVVLQRDSLSYIFSRIRLLSDVPHSSQSVVSLDEHDVLPVSETLP